MPLPHNLILRLLFSVVFILQFILICKKKWVSFALPELPVASCLSRLFKSMDVKLLSNIKFFCILNHFGTYLFELPLLLSISTNLFHR